MTHGEVRAFTVARTHTPTSMGQKFPGDVIESSGRAFQKDWDLIGWAVEGDGGFGCPSRKRLIERRIGSGAPVRQKFTFLRFHGVILAGRHMRLSRFLSAHSYLPAIRSSVAGLTTKRSIIVMRGPPSARFRCRIPGCLLDAF